MKKLLFTLLSLLLIATGVLADIPQNFNYQAVVRDSKGELVKNQQVGVKISIIKTTRKTLADPTITTLYVETFTKTTNANGLLNLKIGTGTAVTGKFSEIDFNIPVSQIAAATTFSIKTEIDPAGGTNYTITGEEKLSSVPYAKVAEKALSLPSITALSTTASGTNSTAIGVKTKALGYASTALGDSTIAEGKFSTAMGYNTTASALNSTAIGYNTTASGGISTAMGCFTTASGGESTAMGDRTTASGENSTAMGFFTTASGDYSTAMGKHTTANSHCQTTVGRYNIFDNSHSYLYWKPEEPLFVIGNGSYDKSSNAVTVLKNGRVGLQTVIKPEYALELPNNADNGIGKARATDWVKYSDGRLKTDRRELPYGLNEVLRLQPLKYFHHNSTTQNGKIAVEQTGSESIGFVAQDVYKVIPEAVNVPKDESADLWGISYDKLIPVLVKAIQEQQAVIHELKDSNKELKQRIEQLEKNK